MIGNGEWAPSGIRSVLYNFYCLGLQWSGFIDKSIVEGTVNPEIETAVASICGTTLGKHEESPQGLVSEGMDTDPSILPLTGGTLEIENAVNSILGESAISNDTDESNNLLFDIKHNAETFSHTDMMGPEHQVVKHNESPLEKDIENGIVRINDSNGMSEPEHLSDLLESTISKNSLSFSKNLCFYLYRPLHLKSISHKVFLS